MGNFVRRNCVYLRNKLKQQATLHETSLHRIFQWFLIINYATFLSGLIAEFVRRHHYCESVSVLSNFAPTEDEAPHRHLKLIPADRRKKTSEARSEDSDRRKKTSEAEDSDPEGAVPLPVDAPKGAIGRLRKGFRLSSVCWDEPGEQ